MIFFHFTSLNGPLGRAERTGEFISADYYTEYFLFVDF